MCDRYLFRYDEGRVEEVVSRVMFELTEKYLTEVNKTDYQFFHFTITTINEIGKGTIRIIESPILKYLLGGF